MNRFFLLIVLACITAMGCKKDKEEEPTPTTPPTSSTTHAARFVAARNVDDLGAGAVASSTAQAMVVTAGGVAVNVDSVRANGLRLINVVAGRYITTDANGLDLSTDDLVWDLGFGSAIHFTHTVAAGTYPTVAEITSPASVSQGNAYTLVSSAVAGADSVVFTLGSLVRVRPANTTSHTFTAAEIQSLAPELYVASIEGLQIQAETYNGMACRFVRMGRRSTMVLVQE